MASYCFRSRLGVGSVQFCREQFILDLVSPDSIRFWGVGGPLLLCPVRNDRSIAVKLVGLSYGDENGTGSQGPEPPWHPGRPENRRLHGIEGYTICPGMAVVIESTEPLPGSA